MSTEKIFGGWDGLLGDNRDDRLTALWTVLAAQNVGTAQQVNNCGLSQRRGEITMLWELYLRAKPKVVVEVGVAQGGTWAGWCQLGLDDAFLIGIDKDVNDCRPRKGDPVSPSIAKPHLMDRNTTNGGGMYAYAKGGQRIVPINGWTTAAHTQEELRLVLGGRKIDFLFHDASHSAPMFAKDFQWLWPLIAEGGIFAAHDIQRSVVPECNKRDEWERILAEESYSAVMEFRGSRHDDSMGIGVLIK